MPNPFPRSGYGSAMPSERDLHDGPAQRLVAGMRLSIHGEGQGDAPGDFFDSLRLHLPVPVPLDVVVSPEAMAKYNEVFIFTLKLKRASINARELWQRLQRLRPSAHQRADFTAAHQLHSMRLHVSCTAHCHPLSSDGEAIHQ